MYIHIYVFYLFYNVIGISHYQLVQNITEDYFFNTLLTPMIIFHSCFFIGDTIYELLTHQRTLFIAHHTASVVQIGILQYNGAELSIYENVWNYLHGLN